MNNADINTVQVLGKIYALISLGYTPRSEIAGSYEKSMSNTFRHCHAVFQSGCTISHSHQKYMKIPISPHPHQNLLFSITVVVVATAGDKKWYLFAVLICISLRNCEVEHLLTSLLATHISPSPKCLFKFFVHFLKNKDFIYVRDRESERTHTRRAEGEEKAE